MSRHNPPGTKAFNKAIYRHAHRGIDDETSYCKEYPLSFIERIYDKWPGLKDFSGYRVSWSARYKMFGDFPLACKWCGIKANCLVLVQERIKLPTDRATFRLYCKTKYLGVIRYIPLTFDHILPRSLGGPNCIENYAILCEKCNHWKGNNVHVTYSYNEVQATTRCQIQRLERETVEIVRMLKELEKHG